MLVDQFTALSGGRMSAALVEKNGELVAGTVEWPSAELVALLATADKLPPLYVEGWSGAKRLLMPLYVDGEVAGGLIAQGDISTAVLDVLQDLQQLAQLILTQAAEKRAIAQETLDRYREINLLYKISETISTNMDPAQIPGLVLAEANRIIPASVGMVALVGELADELYPAAQFGDVQQTQALGALFPEPFAQVLSAGRPAIFTDLVSQGVPMGPVVCAPLRSQWRAFGVILLGRPAGDLVFTAGEEKLLMALASQAAVAAENVYLFADVRRQRDAVAAIKSYMDNVFASIASGVVTTDVRDLVTTVNRAAEQILGIRADETVGRPYVDMAPVGPAIAALVKSVRQQNRPITGYELEPDLPLRGPVFLRLHLSPLRDSQQAATGVAIVLDDLTAHRNLERQVLQVRRTFERYVAPQVVAQLLSTPASVRLGGVREEITVLFADIRGFTTFSARVEPEVQVEVLNRHLTLAAEAILAEEGTLDKFLGDAVMALFNAPLPQPDHTLRAVRAALAMQQAIVHLHDHLPPGERLSFGVGITTGQAVVGNIGSATIHNYTAIGDSVNMAQRLQGHAAPGQILLNHAAFERVREHVQGRELGLVHLKGHSEQDWVYEVVGLR